MFKKLFSKVAAVAVGLFAVGTSANAAITLPTTLDVTGVEAMAGLMLGALAVIWVARKVIGFLRG